MEEKCFFLTREDGSETSTSYARYKIETDKGCYLEKGKEVDHINSDPTDDTLENLQVLEREEHFNKTAKEKVVNKVVLQCLYCGKIFLRIRGMTHLVKNRGDSTSCSRSCGAKVGNGQTNYDKNVLGKIRAKNYYINYIKDNLIGP